MIQKLMSLCSAGLGNSDFLPREEEQGLEGPKAWTVLDDFQDPSRYTGRKLGWGAWEESGGRAFIPWFLFFGVT